MVPVVGNIKSRILSGERTFFWIEKHTSIWVGMCVPVFTRETYVRKNLSGSGGLYILLQ